MKFNHLAIIFVALLLIACGRPEQALPEQEKANFERITAGSDSDE